MGCNIRGDTPHDPRLTNELEELKAKVCALVLENGTLQARMSKIDIATHEADPAMVQQINARISDLQAHVQKNE